MKFLRNYTTLKTLVILTLFLIALSIVYFFFYKARNNTNVYVGISVIRPSTMPITTAPYNWVPYWMSDAIRIGDWEVSPFGESLAHVIEKDVTQGYYYGDLTYLLLSVRATQLKSGVFLYKNRPLSVGTTFDLQLPKVTIKGLVTYVAKDPPHFSYENVDVILQVKYQEQWLANAIKQGDQLTDSKGRVLVKIDSVSVKPSKMLASQLDSLRDQNVLTFDPNKVDIEIKVRLLAKKIDDTYYFNEIQRLKVGEGLFLPLKDVRFEFPITSVTAEK